MGMVTFSFFYGSFGRIIRPWKKNKKKTRGWHLKGWLVHKEQHRIEKITSKYVRIIQRGIANQPFY